LLNVERALVYLRRQDWKMCSKMCRLAKY
jgi:hypothetical protein